MQAGGRERERERGWEAEDRERHTHTHSHTHTHTHIHTHTLTETCGEAGEGVGGLKKERLRDAHTVMHGEGEKRCKR